MDILRETKNGKKFIPVVCLKATVFRFVQLKVQN